MDGAAPIDIVDAHHHLWDLDRLPYGWLRSPSVVLERALGDYEPIRRTFDVEELLGLYRPHRISKSVHVEAACDMAREETAWLQDIADSHGFPHAVVVQCDLADKNVEADLEWHAAHPAVRGVRMRSHPESWRGDGFLHGFRKLASMGMSYEYNASPGLLAQAAELGALFPDAAIVIGHTGAPLQRSPDYFRLWSAELRAAAMGENVHVKVSGLGMADHTWTLESLRPWVHETLEIFGPERCMFGTNWPVDSLYSDLPTLVNSFRVLLCAASTDEQDDFFRRNAERFYRI